MNRYNKEQIATALLIIFVISFVIYLFTGDKKLGEEIVKDKTIIYSVDTQKTVNGVFSLGFGGVKSGVTYYVYQVEGDKGKILKDYSANKTYIQDVLKQDEDSYIVQEYNVIYYKPIHLFQMLEGAVKRTGTNTTTYKGEKCTKITELNYNTLYVPQGYIKKEIDLNIK
jgi:hypothetical protein